MGQERIQKIIAQAGLASRRQAERFIEDGRVLVNGTVVKELGAKADPDTDLIEVSGIGILKPEQKVYILLNKPLKVVTTVDDPQGRDTVIDILFSTQGKGKGPTDLPRVYPVGRLDYDTEGALLLTNDGDIAHKLMHPKLEIDKIYHAKVKGMPSQEVLEKLRHGIRMPDMKGGLERPTAPAKVKIIKKGKANSWIELIIHEGRHRQVRRMLQWVGHSVIRLIRVNYAGFTVTDLKPGAWRYLNFHEVQQLKKLVAEKKIPPPKKGQARNNKKPAIRRKK